MRSIFSISADMDALGNLLEECGGDISTPEVEAAIHAWEAELERDLSNKVDAYCRLVREIEFRAEVRREEASRLTSLAKADERSADSLRDRLRVVLENHGIDRMNTTNHRIAIVKNGGLAPIDVMHPPESFPEEFLRTKTSLELDMAAIRAVLEQGREIINQDSGEILAVLKARGRRIAIR